MMTSKCGALQQFGTFILRNIIHHATFTTEEMRMRMQIDVIANLLVVYTQRYAYTFLGKQF
jgi:hypothetical protein